MAGGDEEYIDLDDGEDADVWEGMDVETFIEQNGLDEQAAAALRSATEDVALEVMSQGPLTGANPSALAMSRLRQAGHEEVPNWDTFTRDLDQRAYEALLASSDGVIKAVMAEGLLTGGNPSAILMARIRKAKEANPMKTNGKSNSVKAARQAARQAGEPQQILRKSAKLSQVEVGDDSSFWAPQGSAFQELGAALSRVNSGIWNFEVSETALMAEFRDVLKARKVAVTAVYEDQYAQVAVPCPKTPEDGEPQKKRRRPAVGATGSQRASADGGLSEGEQSQRKEAVLAEVVRMLQEAGGTLRLQDIGNKQLSELRKGAVGNLAKFLSSHPDVVAVSSSPSGPSVTLV